MARSKKLRHNGANRPSITINKFMCRPCTLHTTLKTPVDSLPALPRQRGLVKAAFSFSDLAQLRSPWATNDGIYNVGQADNAYRATLLVNNVPAYITRMRRNVVRTSRRSTYTL